ncbi:unnamed protein product [Gongylonema pulchrum]|uniref:Uncharacterized protein n=1 Tax=Gongylonema pulchrum TaxID=637853 RepID=A0A183ELV9_9BILA|nr:unnamed protein product [Gongylonema pulchrum]
MSLVEQLTSSSDDRRVALQFAFYNCPLACSGWLSRVEREEKPLPVAIALIPYDTVISATDLFITHLARREGVMVLIAFLILKLLSHGVFVNLIHLFGDLYQNIDYVILFFTKTWVSLFFLLSIFEKSSKNLEFVYFLGDLS